MSTGNPVVFRTDSEGQQFNLLPAVSTRRDDPSSFDEDLLQRLIDDCPSVLPVREFLPSTSTLFSLGREVPVNIGDSEGFIDNLLVTNDGYLVIVETKLYRNPEATRHVVTQTLQYGMAIGRMPVLELEARIRRGQGHALLPEETITIFVSKLAMEARGNPGLLADDFEEAFERHLRRGEILLLIVSDGIRIGVERVTHWLNEQGNSSPFKFGLVELKFYTFGDQHLVIPRTVLKTREVSRHVVVVDIQPSTEVSVTARVTDEFQSATGGKVQESRPIKAAAAPLTKNSFLALLSPEDRQAAFRVIEQLEILRFEPQGFPSTLKFGFTSNDGEFHSLVSLDKSGVWIFPLKKDRDRLGPAAVLEFKKESNTLGAGRFRFYRDDQMEQPDSGSCAVKYRQIEGAASDFAAFLDRYRTKILESFQTGE